jgi:hypothetical protein
MGPYGQVRKAVSTSVHADRDKLIRLRASPSGWGDLPSDSLMQPSRHRHVQRLRRETDTIGRTRDGGPDALTDEAEEGGRSVGRLGDTTHHLEYQIGLSRSHSRLSLPGGSAGRAVGPLRSSETQMALLILPPRGLRLQTAPFFSLKGVLSCETNKIL